MMKTMPLMWCVAAVSAALVMAMPAPSDAKITKELKEELQPAIVKGLESADPLEKAFAILAAGQLKDRTLDKQLLPYLENTNTDVRRAAIVAMAARKDKKGIAALEKEILKAGSGGDFVMTEMMARFPEAIQAAILKSWITGRKTDPKIKASAMTYTARFGRGTVYTLMGAVTSQRKDADRKVYLDLLIANPRVEAAGWAEKLLADKRNAEARLGGLRLAMAIGGAKVDPIIRKALTDADPRISGIALDYLAEAGDLSATDFLIKQLNVSKDKITVAEQLLALDAKVPYDVASKFAASVSKDSGKLAELAQGILGSSRDPKALEALLALEGSTIILDRRLGVAGLGYTKSAKAATVLHRTLFDGHQELRTLSANGLGAIGLGESLSHLDKALRGAAGNKDFKYAIVSAIGKIKTPSAAQKLTYLIRDRDPKVKALALDGLERIGDKTAIEALRTVVSLDPNPEIKFRAALIILRADKASGMAQIGTALQRPPQDYLDSVMALPPNLRDAIVLDHLLKHDKEKIRTETLDGLNYAGEVGLPLLRKATAKGFPKEVRDGAIQALARHTADADVNLFKSLAQTGNDDEKMLAVQWLIRKSNASLAGFFRTLMNGSKGDPARRMAAVYASSRPTPEQPPSPVGTPRFELGSALSNGLCFEDWGARMMNRGLFWLAAVAMFAVGCASGAGDPAEGDPQPVPEPEMVEPTMPPEPDPMPEPEPVPMPDPNPEPMCPVCCPAMSAAPTKPQPRPADGDGTAFEPTTCPEAEVCLDGACQVPPFTCEPGATTCLDTQTQETCNVDGRSVTTLQCQDGLCIGGACRVGTLTADLRVDDDCAGGLCLCSSVEACPVVLDEAIGEGFCTNTDCSAEACLDDELCVNYGLFGGLSDGQHCMKDCDDCTQTGFSCRDVPRLEGEKTVWSEACFTEYPRGMGGECETDADCLGGLCWTGDLNPSDGKGYCTLGCGENADCPSGSSCVDFPDLGFFCGLHCGDGTPGSGGCPVMRGLAVSCQPLSEFETADLKLICAPRR